MQTLLSVMEKIVVKAYTEVKSFCVRLKDLNYNDGHEIMKFQKVFYLDNLCQQLGAI